jgi:hypothetical protein
VEEGKSIRIHKQARIDLRTLMLIFSKFNGRRFDIGWSPPGETARYDRILSSDASGTCSVAAVCHVSGRFVHVNLREGQRVGDLMFIDSDYEEGQSYEQLSITFLEAFALMLGIVSLCRTDRDQLILLHSDNLGVCQRWEKKWSKCRAINACL